jgi:hypothetical protein
MYCMTMGVEQSVEWELAGEPKYSENTVICRAVATQRQLDGRIYQGLSEQWLCKYIPAATYMKATVTQQ